MAEELSVEVDEDKEEEPEENPSSGQQGKEYRPKTDSDKAMAMMFVHSCKLSCANTRAIIIYFGISSSNKLADFQEAHWKDTLTQWQKWYQCPNGMERVMVLLPPQQDRIHCAVWACRHFWHLGWPQVAHA